MWFNFLILRKIASQSSLSFIFISGLVQIFRNTVYAALLLYFTTAVFTLMLYFNTTGVCNCSFPGARSEIWPLWKIWVGQNYNRWQWFKMQHLNLISSSLCYDTGAESAPPVSSYPLLVHYHDPERLQICCSSRRPHVPPLLPIKTTCSYNSRGLM